ncbi:hypothetical protein [Couchioplanes caeruleus]|uniref:Uncharacterized protein n=2 Tax=Couchioplanes caeruleus TaxID=56438 RepID=A0A1K0GYI9_9ACTN|nr:hypothetical protein [Couchioplanes caeruleus]OJF14499.1 hypothetical protein BG844_09160 [Couchioplanes caeruleus subsp. caeruleus]ROP21239.1 hypothetical protein EDD30_7634 [Couchioplanes caeruleus]
MIDGVAPFVHLDVSDADNAPGLSYNVPDPTSFPGRSYITLDFGANDPFRTDVAPPPALPTPVMMLQPRDGNDGDVPRGEPRHQPPVPQAVLRIVEPAPGAVFDSGPTGFDMPVVVQATISNTGARPPTATVTVNGVDTTAPLTGTPGTAVCEYTTAVRVTPGPVSVSARLKLPGNDFATLAPRQVEVREVPTPPPPDTTRPRLTVDTPPAGARLALSGSGTAALEVTGKAADEESGIDSCVLSLDGADATTVAVNADGSFRASLTVTADGDHQVVVLAKNKAGAASQVERQFTVTAMPRLPRHRLMLVECLRLTNFLGRYGAGRIVQTFTLLPGEKTSITIRTFNSQSSTATATSSIFDSFSETTGDELTTAITNEDTTKSQDEQNLKASVNVKAGVTWGWGSASVEAGLAYGTSSAREQLAKNVTNGTSRHAAEKSAKRDVKVDTTKTVISTSENEQTMVRTLENTSLARTVNFTFRQMTQEFVSILHLVDVRVGHLIEWFTPDGKRMMRTPDPDHHPEIQVPLTDYEEVALPQLHSLLRGICADDESAALAEATILRQLDAIFDYRGEWHQVVEEVSRQVPSRDPVTGKIRTEPDPNDPAKTVPATETIAWTRFDPSLRMTYPEPAAGHDTATSGGVPVTVPGIIHAVTTNTLRTDGIVVDAFLGGGLALDDYGVRLQVALARTREAEALQAEQDAARATQALKVAGGGDAANAAIWATVFPHSEPDGDHDREKIRM